MERERASDAFDALCATMESGTAVEVDAAIRAAVDAGFAVHEVTHMIDSSLRRVKHALRRAQRSGG